MRPKLGVRSSKLGPTLWVFVVLVMIVLAQAVFGGVEEVQSIDQVVNQAVESVSPGTTSQPWYKDLFGAIQGSADAKSLQLVLYPTYAPKLANHWGAGGALLYPLGNYAFAGARFDLLDGSYFAASAGVGAKADVTILGQKFTPFALTGVVAPLSGAGDKNKEPGAILGTGLSTVVWQSPNKNARLSAFGEMEYWSQYPGIQIYHLGAQLQLNW